MLTRSSAFVLSVACACGVSNAAEPIPIDQFDHIRAQIAPQEGESRHLDDVPWVATLWEARQKAAAEGKPIFVFATGYHPLGVC